MRNGKANKITAREEARFNPKFIQLAVVKDNRDPQKMGRLKVWISGSGSHENTKESWIDCYYASPFAGRTRGTSNADTFADYPKSYGFWAVPPDVGASVFVFFVNGKIERAYWFSATFDYHMNSSMPGPETKVLGTSEIDSPLPVTEYDRNTQIADIDNPYLNVPLADGLLRQNLLYDTHKGVPNRSSRRQAPAMVYGMSTPRGNHIVLDDGYTDDELTAKNWDEDQNTQQNTEFGNPANDTRSGSRKDEGIVFRTRSGAQLLISESEGNVFVINRDGTGRFEMDAEGNIVFLAYKSFAVRSKEDINWIAERDLKIEVGRNVMWTVGGNSTYEIQGSHSQIHHHEVIINTDKSVRVVAKEEIRFESTLDTSILTNASLRLESISNTNIKSSASLRLESAEDSNIKAGSTMNLESASKTSISASEIQSTAGGTTVTVSGAGLGSTNIVTAPNFVLGAGPSYFGAETFSTGNSLLSHTHGYVDTIPVHVAEVKQLETDSIGVASINVTPTAADPAAPAEPAKSATDITPAFPIRHPQDDVLALEGDTVVNTALEQDLGQAPLKGLSAAGFIMPISGVIQTNGYYGPSTGWDIDCSGDVLAAFSGHVEGVSSSYINISHGNGYNTLYRSISVNDSFQVGDEVKTGRILGSAKHNFLFETRYEGSTITGRSGTLDPGQFYIEDTGTGIECAGAVLTAGKHTNPYYKDNSIDPIPSGSLLVKTIEFMTISSLFPKSGDLAVPKQKESNSSSNNESASNSKAGWTVTTDDIQLFELFKVGDESSEFQARFGFYNNNLHYPFLRQDGTKVIGFGHKVHASENYTAGITETVASQLLYKDMSKATSDANRIYDIYNLSIPHKSQAALVRIVFQFGFENTVKLVSFFNELKVKNYKEAREAIQDTSWYKQQPKINDKVLDFIFKVGE